MDSHARCQHQVSLRGLLRKRLGDSSRWAHAFRQGIGHISERKTRTAGHNKRAFAKNCFGLMPFGNVVEGINSDEKKEPITPLKKPLQPSYGVDAVVGFRRLR